MARGFGAGRAGWPGVAAVIVAFVAAAPAAGQGTDPPHWSGAAYEIGCETQCHSLHHAEGFGLTAASSNVNLCYSCHNAAGFAADVSVSAADKAVPGVSGIHHAFESLAVNSGYSTQLPTDPQMKSRVKCTTDPCPDEATRASEGRIVCSTCHNQHAAGAALGAASRIGAAAKLVDGGGTGTVSPSGVFTGSLGYWYWIEIVQTGPPNARFCWARADETYRPTNPPTWMPAGCDPPGGTLSPNLAATGTVALLDGVSVSFDAGNFAAGERWELSAGYPFLRATLGAGGSSLCNQCHATWRMNTAAVESWNAGAVKSHPVGVSLSSADANNYNQTPLDGNGGTQGGAGADSNDTNDLQLFSGNVECLTCHGIHFVDSNTQTVDPR